MILTAQDVMFELSEHYRLVGKCILSLPNVANLTQPLNIFAVVEGKLSERIVAMPTQHL